MKGHSDAKPVLYFKLFIVWSLFIIIPGLLLKKLSIITSYNFIYIYFPYLIISSSSYLQ